MRITADPGRFVICALAAAAAACGATVSGATGDGSPGASGDGDGGIPDRVREGPFRVLFDNTKGEQAGNADWVVFGGGRLPNPLHPRSETDWKGGLSAWGFALHETGRYELQELPPRSSITFGDASNQQDLSAFDVFVVPEPNSRFAPGEARAMEAFVRAGGGLFAIADHAGADRNNDGVDPVEAWNGFFDELGNAAGVRFDSNNVTDSPDSNVVDDPSAPVLHGPFGHVKATTYYNGATMSVDSQANPAARGLIWRTGAERGDRSVTFAISRLGTGRIAAIGDSSPADDGTGKRGLQNGWDDAKGTNSALFLNATAWLAGDVAR